VQPPAAKYGSLALWASSQIFITNPNGQQMILKNCVS